MERGGGEPDHGPALQRQIQVDPGILLALVILPMVLAVIHDPDFERFDGEVERRYEAAASIYRDLLT